MATFYPLLTQLHLLTVFITITLFILRFYWQRSGSPMQAKRWVRIFPHINDTLLLVSGAALVSITHYYPFSPQGSWLTEKLFGVIIYIVLGFVALGRRPTSDRVRWIAFSVALVAFCLIIALATRKLPLLGIV